MGVEGLWMLLVCSGRRVCPESLEGKELAVGILQAERWRGPGHCRRAGLLGGRALLGCLPVQLAAPLSSF